MPEQNDNKPFKVGDQFKNNDHALYEITAAYGGTATPLPQIYHLKLKAHSAALLTVDQRRITITHEELLKDFFQVRPR